MLTVLGNAERIFIFAEKEIHTLFIFIFGIGFCKTVPCKTDLNLFLKEKSMKQSIQ